MMCTRTLARIAVGLTTCLLLAGNLLAQSVCLPAPRLLTTLPMGGQVGSEFDVTITGQDIDGTEALLFSNPKISATAVIGEDGLPVANKFRITIASDCDVGIYEARVMTRLGLSSARVFSVGDLPEVTQVKPNTSLEKAMKLEVNSICNGALTTQAVDHYQFDAKAGQRIAVDCSARGIDSKTNPVVIVADADGNDLVVERRGGAIDFEAPNTGTYTVKVHELTFKGGAHYFYRLALRELDADALLTRMPGTQSVSSFSWPPAGLAKQAALSENDEDQPQRVELPCDVSGRFFPAADVDSYEFVAKKGDVWWVEVASERLGLPTDPSVLIQHVVMVDGKETLTDVAEMSDIASPVKVSSNGYSYDGPPYNAGSADVLAKLEIKQDGLHRLKITDLFGGTRTDPRNKYRLVIRKAEPDFALVAWALHMNLRNGDRNALSKPMALRRGATMPIEVVVVRRDGFQGEIELSMENLPDGVTAAGMKIAAGKSRGIMLVTADEGAPRGMSQARFVGTATIGDETVSRPVRLASMAWPVPNAWSEIPAPRLLADLPVSVGGSEVAPITIAARDEKVFEVTQGQTLKLPLIHMRRSEFSGANISLKTFGDGFEKNGAFDAPLTADASEAVLDLAKLKTPPGEYLIAFYGSAVAKHRHNVDAIALAEAKQKDAQAEVARLSAEVEQLLSQSKQAEGDEKAKAENAHRDAVQKHKAADAALKAVTRQVAAATARAKPKDIVDIIVSKPIAIRVKPAEKK